MSVPSIKTLATWLGPEHASPLRKALQADDMEEANRIVDAAIGAYGVEHIYNGTGRAVLAYINRGDPYERTILRHRAGSYTVGCWWDWLESYERRHGRLP